MGALEHGLLGKGRVVLGSTKRCHMEEINTHDPVSPQLAAPAGKGIGSMCPERGRVSHSLELGH